MRFFSAISSFALLSLALIPIGFAAAFTIGFKGILYAFSLFISDRNKWKSVTGTPPSIDSPDTFRFDEMIPTEVLYTSIATLLLSLILFIAYVFLTYSVIGRRGRPVVWIGISAIVCHIYFLITYFAFYYGTTLSFNHNKVPGLLAYPSISILLIGSLIFISRHRFRNEPPLLFQAAEQDAAANP